MKFAQIHEAKYYQPESLKGLPQWIDKDLNLNSDDDREYVQWVRQYREVLDDRVVSRLINSAKNFGVKDRYTHEDWIEHTLGEFVFWEDLDPYTDGNSDLGGRAISDVMAHIEDILT